MSSIDERIVQMKFDNNTFEQKIKQTVDSLGTLKSKLNFDGVKSGLTDLASSINNTSLSHLSNSVDSVISKFNGMTAVGIAAITNITNKAINAGSQLLKSLTIDPISSGLKEYEMNLNGIQTILANTKNKGENLKSVGAALDDLNAYSDKTIYNFGQMVNGIKTLTTAGADLKTGVNTVKGFANAAALAGVGAEQMASALQYGLNQAITKGRMMAQDWMSLETSGIAGEGFKNAIMDTARVNGVAVDQIIKKSGSFRESLKEGWLTADILQQTLAKYTGEMTDAQLRQLGYTEKQIKAIQDTAAEAVKSATKVKTVTQLISTLQEAAQSGWSKSWTFLFGDLNEAIDLFTNMSDVIGGMIGASANARNKMLEDWKKLGGRTATIEALGNVFKSLMDIFKSISSAFKEIFPPTTGKQLYNMTLGFKKFTEGLLLNKDMLSKLKSTFKGLFAVLDIIWMVVKGVVGVFAKLLEPLGLAGGGVLTFTGGIGDFLVKVRDAIKTGGSLTSIFKFIGDVLQGPIDLIKKLSSAMSANSGVANGWNDIWKNIGNVFKAIWDWMKPAVDWFVGAMAATKDALAGAFKAFDFNSILLILNTGLLGGGILIVKKFLDFLKNRLKPVGASIVDKIKAAFTQLTDTMKAMQQQIKAETLIKIAIAIGILTASVVILSMIDIAKLGAALGAITVMFVQLVVVMKALEKIGTTKSATKMFIISAALITLSTAMVIFAAAVTIMSKLSWEELARGLGGMAVALILISNTSKSLSKNTGSIAKAAFGILLISGALLVLATAMKTFASLSWEDLGKGTAVLAVMLPILSGFSKSLGKAKSLAANAFGLVLISGALFILAQAMKSFATMSWEDLGKGAAILLVSLTIMSFALNLMSGTVSGSIALIIASTALLILAQAMKVLGSLSWEQVGVGMTMLAGSLILLSGAMLLMNAALPGAAALIIAATAIAILAPAMKLLGSMKWDQVGVGLTMLAASLAIIAGAGYLLIGALPGLIGLGVTALLIGTGAMLAGTGILLFAQGLLALAGASAIGGAAILLMVTGLINLIPLLLQKVAEGIVKIAQVISGSTIQFIGAFTAILTAIVTAIGNVTPLIITTIFNLLSLLITKLRENVPMFVSAGFDIMIGFLDGIAKKLPALMQKGTDVIVAFIRGISKSMPRIINEGMNFVVSFIEGVADGIKTNSDKMITAGSKLFRAIVTGVIKAIKQSGSDLAWAGGQIGNLILDAAKSMLGIHSPSKEFFKIGQFATQGLVNGLDSTANMITKSASNVGQTALDGLNSTLSSISDVAMSNIDMNPTIRPVLDLSAIKKDSTSINSLLSPSAISVDSAYSQAASIAVDKQIATEQAITQQDTTASSTTGTSITFVQNNNSPKALSAAEIYRQTKNQISAARGISQVA